MKIPETTTNVGAYYGNEEDGQWQPNGVIIDGGVGGGVVGSGDAGVHRPSVYPVHIPRGHMPAGYVMTGAYYPPAPYAPVPAPAQDDFEDYMWMENEEEFDKQKLCICICKFIGKCLEAVLNPMQKESSKSIYYSIDRFCLNSSLFRTSNGAPSLSLEETVSRSTLNPLAAEFVPTRVRQPPPHSTAPLTGSNYKSKPSPDPLVEQFKPVRTSYADISSTVPNKSAYIPYPSPNSVPSPMCPEPSPSTVQSAPNSSYRKTIYIHRKPRQELGTTYDHLAHANIVSSPPSSLPNGCALGDNSPNISTANDNLVQILSTALINIFSKCGDIQPYNVIDMLQKIITSLINSSIQNGEGPSMELS
ncbi:hypothetical protein K1T71_015051 [Dendrolimus kikuchii]|nr:hypothetical protein K1T71_015051 [Dendrolimus kikuchii]